MENKKLLRGAWPKNVVMGVSWLIPVFGIVAFILDFNTLDYEEKKDFVTIFVSDAIILICTFVSWLVLPAILEIVVFVFMVIAAIKAFKGESYKIPVLSDLAAKFVK